MDFDEQYFEIQPHGRLLVLTLPEGKSLTSEWPITDHLRPFFNMPKPFVGLIVDVGNNAFTFDAGDLTALVSTVSKRGKAETSPCIVVIHGEHAKRLRWMLDVTKLSPLVKIADSFESAIAMVRATLDSSGPGASTLLRHTCPSTP